MERKLWRLLFGFQVFFFSFVNFGSLFVTRSMFSRLCRTASVFFTNVALLISKLTKVADPQPRFQLVAFAFRCFCCCAWLLSHVALGNYYALRRLPRQKGRAAAADCSSCGFSHRSSQAPLLQVTWSIFGWLKYNISPEPWGLSTVRSSLRT